MKEETTNKLELENGVSLGEHMEYEGTYKLSKEEVRTVFSGTVDKIFCRCAVPDCDIARCGDSFSVERNDKGGIFIGCVYFNPLQVATVRNWLGE